MEKVEERELLELGDRVRTVTGSKVRTGNKEPDPVGPCMAYTEGIWPSSERNGELLEVLSKLLIRRQAC